MAEIAVGYVIDKLIPLLSEKAQLLRDVHGEVSDIKDELECIQSFLKDADARAATEGDINHGVKTWVKQLREIAFRIEDVVDEYLQHQAERDHHRGLTAVRHKVARLVTTVRSCQEIISDIREIQASLQRMKERSERYGFRSSEQGSSSVSRNVRWSSDPRRASLYLNEADLVGIEYPRTELIGWLTEERSHRTVISVVGMGGIGKTTLAKIVYDCQKVNFDCHAWIAVSQSYTTEDLLRSMIQQFCKSRKDPSIEGIDTMDEISLIDEAREYLQDKRYVIVFDDVWKIDFWAEIEHAFPDYNKDDRIMITTRNKDVADFCKKSSRVCVHLLQVLTQDKAWELFCKKVFQFDSDGNCPTYLEKISRNIVERCQGLPLAIVAVGGLLLTKDKNVYEWQKLYDTLGSELGENPHLSGVREILSLSYYDLPYYLKSCFLYFGMYSEDYSINCVRLIRQWIAEGFVKETKGKTLEEVAQEYLTELIHRSLVQVSEFNFDGKARTCQLHDLLREIVLHKMEDLTFCYVCSKDQLSFNGLTRRLSINNSPYEFLARFENSPVRSILIFVVDVLLESSMDTILAKFKLLKVMDFENAPLNHVPEDLGNLFHLRYLSLRNTMVKSLPKSIGNLQNLETLDLKQSLVCEIPIEINKLKKLRYLIAYYRDYSKDFALTQEKGVKIHSGIGSLKALQKLYHVDADHEGVDLVEELKKLKQLRKLGIKILKMETGKALCAAIEQMCQLESLDITSINDYVVIHLPSISFQPQNFRRLHLKGRLEKLSNWISKLQNLVRLVMGWSRLSDDPMKTLQYLPNLLQLEISNEAYVGVQMHVEEGGFPKLKDLRLRHMNGLELVIISKGALPLLKNLEIGPFPKMKEVPSGIQYLRNLKYLCFYDMPIEFEDSLDPKEGTHYWIVQHVPVVNIFYQIGARSYTRRTL